MQLDSRDLRLLFALQTDCRTSNAELAQSVGMSASALWRRVRSFEDAGLIKRYGAIVEPAALGLSFEAIVHVQLMRHDPDQMAAFIAAIEQKPEVQDCFATTGQADYHLHVLCKDLAAYNAFLEEFLFRQPAVSSAQTNVVLKSVKRNGPITTAS